MSALLPGFSESGGGLLRGHVEVDLSPLLAILEAGCEHHGLVAARLARLAMRLRMIGATEPGHQPHEPLEDALLLQRQSRHQASYLHLLGVRWRERLRHRLLGGLRLDAPFQTLP